jgi:hypothetical protein
MTKVSAPVKRNTGPYNLLQEVYKGVCTDYCTHGKCFKQGHQISVECGLLIRIRHLKIKDGHNPYPSIPRMGKEI